MMRTTAWFERVFGRTPPAGPDTVPPSALAQALSALARAHFAGDAASDAMLSAAFTQLIAKLDAADATYRAQIGKLAPPKARATLAALTTFRSRVAEIRERVRNAGSFAEFDPLDTYVPAFEGSHAGAVQAANAADRARHEVADLRAHVNAEIGALLERDEIEWLSEAKRNRNADFDRLLRQALPPPTGDKLATRLLLLIDGWY